MATASDVLKVARAEIGYKEYPSGSNKTKYGKEYGMNGVAWCAEFVWWVFKHAGCPEAFYGGKKCAYCPTIADYYIAHKQTVSKSSGKAGDIVLFGFGHTNSQHIGIIEKKNSDGSYVCIEGNTSVGNNCNGGMVMRRTRYQSQINWIVRPQFTKIEGHKSTYVPTKPYTGTVPSKNAEYGTTDNVPVMTFLNWCLGINLGKDGIFGVKSRQAIYDYQATYGLEQDGIFGPKCIAKAKEIINAHKKGVHKMGHCASRALDCVEANFTYSSSTSSPYHWTYVAVWKDAALAEKCAEFAEQCNKRTPRIQYDDKPNLKSKVIANGGNMPSGSLTGNCSNYVNACVYHASKVNVLDYGAKNNRKYLEASGLFNIYEGDKVKGYIQRGAIYGGSHHTVISLGIK